MSAIQMDQFVKIFRAMNKYDIDNQLHFEIHAPGSITYKMKIEAKHLSSPDTAHGAVIAGFMDCVLGLSALSQAIVESNLTSTVEFKINFTRPVKIGDEIIGTGKVIHKGKSLIISSGEVRNSKGDLVAIGQGTFNTYPISKKDFASEFTSPV